MFDHLKSSKRVLEPQERVAEVLFGLIMFLGFTGSLSVADLAGDGVRTMLIGALGCNLAWGIIDGIMYLMDCLADKGRKLRMLRAARIAADPKKGQRIVADALPSPIASVLKPEEIESIRERLTQLPEPAAFPHLSKSDWVGAVGVFLLVFLSMFPAAVPFMLIDNARVAMRVSNGIAVAMLFISGFVYGRCIGRSPKLIGLGLVIVGAVLVALTIALGG